MSEDWCCEKLESLKIKEHRLETLTEIRGRLNGAANLETVVTNKLLIAPELYECVVDDGPNNSEQSDLVSDILSICMDNLSINNDMPQLLKRSLEHQQSRIRALALSTILKELESRKNTSDERLAVSKELFMQILEMLQHEETQVGITAINIMAIILEERIEEQSVQETLLRMLEVNNETIKCRVYELAVTLAKHSEDTLVKVQFLLEHALAELDNDDVLLQVNILEILYSLAEENHGVAFLERRQIFDVISRRVEALEQNPLDSLLVPGIMKFFGKIAYVHPEKIIIGYPSMVNCLFNCFHSGDISLLPVTFDTLANITHSKEGKLLLDEYYTTTMKQTLLKYIMYLGNLTSDLKVRAFNSLELIFTTEETVTNDVNQTLLKWFTFLVSGTNIQIIMDSCRNPFPDIKVACLSFIKVICKYDWGVKTMKEVAGFIEYLLDRKIEFDREAKYAKYEVIKILSESNVFDVQTHIQLRTYVNEGPYYIEVAMDVATEGN